MLLTANTSELSGEVAIPGSKSHTIRAVFIASMANGTSRIANPLVSNDTHSAVDCCRCLGAKIDTSDDTCWVVEGTAGIINPEKRTINVGNSGTTINLAIGIASLTDTVAEIQLTGDEQIQKRPSGPIINSINDLGAKAKSLKDNGCPPIAVSGKLKGGKTTIECQSSQYLSSLLLACPLATEDTEIAVPLLYEADYVRITLDWLDKQGINYKTKGDLSWFHVPGRQYYKAFEEPVPADFSSATFFLCAGALIGNEILIRGLDFNDSQPDKAVADYLIAMGADLRCTPEGIHVGRSDLVGCEIDMNATPDALPAMAVTAALAEGTTKLVNVPQARHKETDRIACMAKELTKLGANVEELSDGLIIHGRGVDSLIPADVHGYGDHRIVMALSIAGMVMGPISIDTAESMNVTFPEYVTLMKKLGANMALTH